MQPKYQAQPSAGLSPFQRLSYDKLPDSALEIVLDITSERIRIAQVLVELYEYEFDSDRAELRLPTDDLGPVAFRWSFTAEDPRLYAKFRRLRHAKLSEMSSGKQNR